MVSLSCGNQGTSFKWLIPVHPRVTAGLMFSCFSQLRLNIKTHNVPPDSVSSRSFLVDPCGVEQTCRLFFNCTRFLHETGSFCLKPFFNRQAFPASCFVQIMHFINISLTSKHGGLFTRFGHGTKLLTGDMAHARGSWAHQKGHNVPNGDFEAVGNWTLLLSDSFARFGLYAPHNSVRDSGCRVLGYFDSIPKLVSSHLTW